MKLFSRGILISLAVVALGIGTLLFVWWYTSQEFDDDATPVDFQAIYRLAILAKDVYDLSDQEFRSKYDAVASKLDVRELPASQVRYLVLVDDTKKMQTVAVRGSSNLRNWIINTAYVQQPDPELKLTLHSGFREAANELYRSVMPHLTKGYRTSITGHSLGGALAAVLMMRLMHEGHEIDQVITFGQPKVTNEIGASLFAKSKLLRVVNGDDIVPKLPNPTIASSLRGLYYHFASEVDLLPNGKYARRKPVLELPPELPEETREKAGRGLLDTYLYPHFMSAYIANLEAELAGATRIEAADLGRQLPPTPVPGGPAYSPPGPDGGIVTAPSSRVALLVGIDHYQSGGINPLTGCINDVHAMKELLVSRYGFVSADVKTLTDGDATRDEILRLFDEHLMNRSGPDTVAVFHFSGHGSQMKDVLGIAPGGMQRTIVPHDSRLPGHFDVSDDQLRSRFSNLASRVKALTVVLDCCHSGSGGRGPRARVIEPDLRDPPPTADPAKLRAEVAASAPDGKHPYTLIAACAAHELAYELGSGPEADGALTKYFTTEADKPQSKSLTYRDLMDTVAYRVHAAYPNQSPQLEGPDSREVFGASTSRAQAFVLISPRPDGVPVLMAGVSVGMTRGSRFDVYAPGTKVFDDPDQATPLPGIARIDLDEVSPFTSTARFVGGDGPAGGKPLLIPMAARAVERVHAYERFALDVFLAGPNGSEVLKAVRDALTPIKHIRVTDQDRDAVLIVEEKDRKVTILAPDDKVVRESFPADAQETPAQIVDRLKQWAKWFNLLRLQNPEPTFNVPFGLQAATTSQTNAKGLPSFQALQEVPLVLRNADTQSFYFSILDLQSNGSVDVIFPREGDVARLTPGQDWSRKLRFRVPDVRQLRRFSSLETPADLPRLGKDLVVVARIKQVLHFRVFDGEGQMVVDTNETRLKDRQREVQELRKQLDGSWASQQLKADETNRLIDAVTSVVGHPQPQRYQSIRDYLLVIATREPVRAHFLKMPAITRELSRNFDPLQQLLSDAAFGDREVEVLDVDSGSWATALFGCETHR
jgi:hypothetical protein